MNGYRRVIRPIVAGLSAACLSLGALATQALAEPGDHTAVVAGDLRVDANRDGRVDVSMSGDEPGTSQGRAVFLPNLDDDADRCDGRIGGCHDASDGVVNGSRDAADLATIRSVPLPRLPAAATGTVRVSAGAGQVRLFLRTPRGWTPVADSMKLSAAQLRAGIQLGLEGRDIVRDRTVWDGSARVELTVSSGGRTTTDTVPLRIAGLLATNHTMPARQVVISKPPANGYNNAATFTRSLRTILRQAGTPLRTLDPPYIDYIQDFFEQMYAEMPAPGGRMHRISILMLNDTPDRWARGVAELRGPGFGLVWTGEGVANSYGNLETIPPYRHASVSYPHGRPVVGVRPASDPAMSEVTAFIDLMRAQGHDPLLLDVDFLGVGHVDEIVQFLPAKSARGWQLAVADPRLGIDLLRQAKAAGAGGQKVVTHRMSQAPTVAEALDRNKTTIVADNVAAAARIEKNIATIKAATGITDAEITRIPALYRRSADPSLLPLIPSALNSLLATPRTLVVAKQHGVLVGGKDVFAEAVTGAYRSAGMTVRFIDDYVTLHLGAGDVHCGTNTLRVLPGE